MSNIKEWDVIYRSRYNPMEGDRHKKVNAISKSEIRVNWHSIIHTDEYKIIQITEIKKGEVMSKEKLLLESDKIILAAKFFSISNTGLIGCTYSMPKCKSDLESLYMRIDNDYASELEDCDGLNDEFKIWKKDIIKNPDKFIPRLKEALPWLFDE